MSNPAQILMEPLRRARWRTRPGLETTCVAAYVQEVALTIAADKGGLKAKARKVAAARANIARIKRALRMRGG